MRQNRGRVQINPKSYDKRQTTWRREKIETKGRNREEIKAAEEKKRKKKKKGILTLTSLSNMNVKVRVISFNERG